MCGRLLADGFAGWRFNFKPSYLMVNNFVVYVKIHMGHGLLKLSGRTAGLGEPSYHTTI